MAVVDSSTQAVTDINAARGTRFPGFDLRSCIEVPRVLHAKGGGQATPDQMAAHLGYKGTNNGSYLTKMGATNLFGLIAKNGPVYIPTPLAYQILSPTYPHDQKKALVEAFLNVPLFKKIYEDFKGKELPPEFGMKNALRLTYAVNATRVADAYRILMDSAETAGFFETKSGAKTHLIMPLTLPVPGTATPAAPEDNTEVTGGGGGGGGSGDGGNDNNAEKKANEQSRITPRTPASGMADVKAQYLSTLIKLFEDKAAKGDVDEKLMERIERLIGAP